MTDLYRDLGIERDAPQISIKGAHRRAAKRTHPDAGGNPDEFAKVQRAAMVLCDPAKRARYDETGEVDDGPNNDTSRIAALLIGAFDRAMSAGNHKVVDIIDRAVEFLRTDRKAVNETARNLQNELGIITDAKDRLAFEGSGANLIGAMLDERAVAVRAAQREADKQIEMIDAAIEGSAAYAWRFDRPPPPEASPYAAFSARQNNGIFSL